MLGVFAEFETNLRRERQLEGIAKAKAAGVYRGRKPSIDQAQVEKLKAEGLGATEIAKRLSIGRALSTASYLIVGAIRVRLCTGLDTRAIQAWMVHKNIQRTVRYTELAPDRFNDFFVETSGLNLPYNEAPGHLTNGTPERSNNCGQVETLIYFRVIGVAFCCNIALGTGGGTSS
jgi:hypothetical protein